MNSFSLMCLCGFGFILILVAILIKMSVVKKVLVIVIALAIMGYGAYAYTNTPQEGAASRAHYMISNGAKVFHEGKEIDPNTVDLEDYTIKFNVKKNKVILVEVRNEE